MEEEDELFNVSICITDVYNLAADISLEFETIADSCGPDIIRNLVNKVITVLEHLENSVIKLQSLSDYLIQLKHQIHELKLKRSTHAEHKMKLEQDFVDAEESWSKEIIQLNEKIFFLQTENKQLQNQSWVKPANVPDYSVPDNYVVQQLESLVSSLNYQLKEKDATLEKCAFEIATLKQSVEQQSDVKENLHKRIRDYDNEIKQLWLDKRDLRIKLEEQEEVIVSVKRQLDDSASLKMEEHVAPSRSVVTQLDEQFIYDESLKYYKQERELFLTKINELQMELINSQKETEHLRNKYSKKPAKPPRHKAQSSPGSAIRQLFRLFRDVGEESDPIFRC